MARPETKQPVAKTPMRPATARPGARPRPANDNMNLYIMIGIIAVAIIAVGGVIYFTQSSANEKFTIDDERFATYAGIPLDDTLKDANREVEVADDLAEGVVQGITDEGIPYIGSPNAPVVFAEFADFSCPHCREYETIAEQLVRDYVRTGQMRLEFYPLTFVGDSYSVVATQGAICAAEQGAFWEFQKQLFTYQSTQGYQSFTQDNMVEWGKDLGLDEKAMKKCINSPRPERSMTNAEQLQLANGVTGTPSVLWRANGSTSWTKFEDPTNLSALAGVVSQFNNPESAE